MVTTEAQLRYIAQKSQHKAFVYFWLAGILASIPILLYFFLKLTKISILIYVSCWVSAFFSQRRGKKLQRFAEIARGGVRGEGEIGLMLTPLQYKGWTIEYNVPVSYWGDADVFLRSPKGRCFAVNVKNYLGNIFFDGVHLLAVDRGEVYTDKDMLKMARGQADYLKNIKSTRNVTPILCFTHAKLEMGNAILQNVYVVNKNALIPLLKKLG